MPTSGSFLDPYPIDKCPHCGGLLDPPDDNFNRRCGACRFTVMAATVEWEIVD